MLPQEDASVVEYIPRSRFRFDDLDAIADAAVSGHGMAWLPLWLVRDRIHSGDLVRIFDEHPAPGFNIYALWPPMPYMAARVRAALDHLVNETPGFLSPPGG
jgi:DNA-binding transcriptional LysR family regulator